MSKSRWVIITGSPFMYEFHGNVGYLEHETSSTFMCCGAKNKVAHQGSSNPSSYRPLTYEDGLRNPKLKKQIQAILEHHLKGGPITITADDIISLLPHEKEELILTIEDHRDDEPVFALTKSELELLLRVVTKERYAPVHEHSKAQSDAIKILKQRLETI